MPLPLAGKLRPSNSMLGDVPESTRPDEPGGLVGGSPSFVRREVRIRPPALLNNTVFVNRGVSVGTESEEVLPANGGRNYLLIQNRSAGPINVSFGNKADNFNGIDIQSGGNYEPYIVPGNSVNIAASAPGSQIVVLEGYGTQVT